jgi:formylglycine-generating enzyme required for sulfatase activity
VGIFPLDVTPEGIFDMGGNVWDWCADWFGEYPEKPESNPRGPEKASSRVFRAR